MFASGRHVRSVGKVNFIRTLATSPSPDLNFLLNPMNRHKIIDNLTKRLQLKDSTKAIGMLDSLSEIKKESLKSPTKENRARLISAAIKFPNATHPDVANLKEPTPIYVTDEWKPKSALADNQYVRPFEEVAKSMGFPVRTDNTGQISTEKSYFLYNKIAELEQALVRYALY